MWVVRNKRQTLKQQLSFPFSQAQLDLLPDSSLPPLLSLQVILSQSPFREEASGAKGVLRGCDQGVVVSLFLSFLLHVHHPQAVENICSAMEHALLWPWGSLLILTLSNSPSISAGHFPPLLKYVFPEVQLPVHGYLASFQKGHPCCLHPAKPGHKQPIPKVLH